MVVGPQDDEARVYRLAHSLETPAQPKEPTTSDETIRPDTKAFLEALAAFDFPAIETQTPDAARASLVASLDFVDLPMGDLATVEELNIPGPAGDIPALLLDPRATRDPGPVLIWLHGGGSSPEAPPPVAATAPTSPGNSTCQSSSLTTA